MLDELHVEGYALISRLTIKFTKGLNVLSGETGAGKSILIGALSESEAANRTGEN